MQELDRRHESKIVRRDLILELVIIALIVAEIVIGIGGIVIGIKEGRDQPPRATLCLRSPCASRAGGQPVTSPTWKICLAVEATRPQVELHPSERTFRLSDLTERSLTDRRWSYELRTRRPGVRVPPGAPHSKSLLSVQRFNADDEIQGLLRELTADPDGLGPVISGGYSPASSARISALAIDRAAFGKKDLHCEKIDQLTTEILLGVR